MPRPRTPIPIRFATLLVAVLAAPPAGAASSPAAAAATDSVTAAFVVLPDLEARDLPARGRLFDRGIPIGMDAFSPEGFHLAYLHQILGGFPRRRPERCVFLLDLGTLENRSVKTPKGRAVRVGGWDPTGRHLLIESTSPNLFSPFTGRSTTFHWVFDVVTSQFPQRKGFTGLRDGDRFRWKQDGTYHGVWDDADGTTVVPLRAGEFAERLAALEPALDGETKRRTDEAGSFAVGADTNELRTLDRELARLDEHWTRRGQKDPVVSELFGERPNLYARRFGEWALIAEEIEYVAVLDHGLALVTREGGRQVIVHRRRGEIAALPAAPEEFARQLGARWDRAGGAYDESDPLPRDLQYRRSHDAATGTAYYYNYVTPDLRRALVLYSIDAERRVLRVVDLPAPWGEAVSEAAEIRAPVP